jgi:hypothetical protein
LYTTILNLRLRRQHETQVPANRNLEDRALKQNGEFEDEDSATKWAKYKEGLDRLHQAIVRIDTTVMLFNNFSS